MQGGVCERYTVTCIAAMASHLPLLIYSCFVWLGKKEGERERTGAALELLDDGEGREGGGGGENRGTVTPTRDLARVANNNSKKQQQQQQQQSGHKSCHTVRYHSPPHG